MSNSAKNNLTRSADYQFYKVEKLCKIKNGVTLEVSVGKWNILLCGYEDNIYALQNLCTHEDRKLTGGCLQRGQIICPFHGASFDLVTGDVCDPPATDAIKTFLVRIIDGIIEVAIPRC